MGGNSLALVNGVCPGAGSMCPESSCVQAFSIRSAGQLDPGAHSAGPDLLAYYRAGDGAELRLGTHAPWLLTEVTEATTSMRQTRRPDG